jgi:membrane protease YdiL (CAAX protease family)
MRRTFLPEVTRKEVTLSGETPEKMSSKNLGSPAWVISITLLIFLIAQLLIAPLIVGIAHLVFSPHSALNLDKSIPAQFLFILAAEAGVAGLAITMVRRRHLSLKVIGLGRWPVWRDIWQAALGFGIFYGLLIITGIIVSLFAPNVNNEQQNIGFNNISTHIQNLLAFISLVILPPIGEETLVRGYLFSGLRMAWRFWPAVLVTSLFFGAAHLEFGSGGPLVWAAAIDTFLLSIVLCFLRDRSGALYAGMLVHMANNLIAFGVHFK